jgi:hypothetical protein
MRQLQPPGSRAETFQVEALIAEGFLSSDEGGLAPSIEAAPLCFVGVSDSSVEK